MNLNHYILLLLVSLTLCCTSEHQEKRIDSDEQLLRELPFKTISLEDLSLFNPVDSNWQIAGDVYVDRSKNGIIVPSPGSGVLVNIPGKGNRENLFTNFEHGDIELELDVMMPVQSNSGIYFQGRYEIQLLDSWGVKTPEHSDIGGIYQRWDPTKEVEQRGYEGRPPSVNAAKAPGLWQHFHIKFHAPIFAESGEKIKNAWFEEVWLNGTLLHKNQEVTGPTRAAAFNDEKSTGPIMIQGDHGPVAFRNIRYKLYNKQNLAFSDIAMQEYENKSRMIPDLDTLVLSREINTDTISSLMATGENPQKLLVYSGILNIQDSGKYLFEMGIRGGGGLLLIDQDTIVNLNGDYTIDQPGFGLVSLSQGDVPFTFIYNKHRPYQRGFVLYVEGPGIARHVLHAPGSLSLNQGNQMEPIVIGPYEEPIVQRTFLMHKDRKRTHCASVATPQGLHYSFDLAFGSLLQVWSGGFLDVTKMWRSRGGQQLGEPITLPILIHGDPDFAYLQNDQTSWPDTLPINVTYKPLGYELDKEGLPTFSQQVGETIIHNKIIPSDTIRTLTRMISIQADQEIWHKIAAGGVIQKLPDGTFAVDDKNYFVDFPKNQGSEPLLRQIEGKDELLLKIPEGINEFNYHIIW